jgi:RimJ/RimL family protein N-acetyltransferase
MKIHTNRLILREYSTTDLEAIHEYAGDPKAVKYMSFGPNTLKDSQDFINRSINYQKEEERVNFELAVVKKDDLKLIGGCGIRKESKIQCVIGYIFNREYWGQGYGTETARALVDFGFTELGVHRVYATCDTENVASRRVLEKAGMALEGTLRGNTIRQGEFRDSFILSILRHEWKKT